jgi:uracil-DNA glycosylase
MTNISYNNLHAQYLKAMGIQSWVRRHIPPALTPSPTKVSTTMPDKHTISENTPAVNTNEPPVHQLATANAAPLPPEDSQVPIRAITNAASLPLDEPPISPSLETASPPADKPSPTSPPLETALPPADKPSPTSPPLGTASPPADKPSPTSPPLGTASPPADKPSPTSPPLGTASPPSNEPPPISSSLETASPPADEPLPIPHLATANAALPPLLFEDSPLDELDWDSLENRVAGCTACDLHKTRTQTVFGAGNRQTDLMLIGEAPGADEDEQGEPFVGRAGLLLTDMIHAIELKRETVYITNVVKCRPPENRNPEPHELACCNAFLQRQIELIKPKLIIVVGRVAAHHLLETDTPISKLRQQRFEYGETKIPLIATYHPAYLLRRPSEKRQSWQDLQFIYQTMTELKT